MKSFILAAVVFGAISSASANATIGLDIQATDQQGNAVGTAKCSIVQSTSSSDLKSVWTCEFNGGAAQTLDTVADYVTNDTSDSQLQIVDYSLTAGQDLGDFLFQGLNMIGASGFAPLIITLGAAPSTELPFVMVSAGDSSYYYMNVTLN
jgi:hypothetical protein